MSWLMVTLAAASPSYPDVLAEGAPCTPPCTVCHASPAGGAGTVTTAFGEALMTAGLTGGGDDDRLADLAAAHAADSDGDGVTDLAALADGLDPNEGAALCATDRPRHGCLDHGDIGPTAWCLAPWWWRRRTRGARATLTRASTPAG